MIPGTVLAGDAITKVTMVDTHVGAVLCPFLDVGWRRISRHGWRGRGLKPFFGRCGCCTMTTGSVVGLEFCQLKVGCESLPYADMLVYGRFVGCGGRSGGSDSRVGSEGFDTDFVRTVDRSAGRWRLIRVLIRDGSSREGWHRRCSRSAVPF